MLFFPCGAGRRSSPATRGFPRERQCLFPSPFPLVWRTGPCVARGFQVTASPPFPSTLPPPKMTPPRKAPSLFYDGTARSRVRSPFKSDPPLFSTWTGVLRGLRPFPLTEVALFFLVFFFSMPGAGIAVFPRAGPSPFPSPSLP